MEEGRRALEGFFLALDRWTGAEGEAEERVYHLEGEEGDGDIALDIQAIYLDALYFQTPMEGGGGGGGGGGGRGQILAHFAESLGRRSTRQLRQAILLSSDMVQDKYRTIVPRAMESARQQASSSPEKMSGSSSGMGLSENETSRLTIYLNGQPETSPKMLMEELRTQESMLQLILCLELLTREPIPDGKKKRRKRPSAGEASDPDLETYFEVLKDRLAIWQALSTSTALAITTLLTNVLRPLYSERSKANYRKLVAAFGEAPNLDQIASETLDSLEARTSPIAPKKRRKPAVDAEKASSPTLKRLLASKNESNDPDPTTRSRKGKPKRLDVEHLRQQVEDRAKRAAQKTRTRRGDERRRADSPTPMARTKDVDLSSMAGERNLGSREKGQLVKPRPGTLVRNRSLSLFKSREVDMTKRAMCLERSSSFTGAASGRTAGQEKRPVAGMRRVKTLANLPRNHNGYPTEDIPLFNSSRSIARDVRTSPRKLHKPVRLSSSTRDALSDALVANTPRIDRISHGGREVEQIHASTRPIFISATPLRQPSFTAIPASEQATSKRRTENRLFAPTDMTPPLHSNTSTWTSSSFVEPPTFNQSFEPPIFVEATPHKTSRQMCRHPEPIPVLVRSTPARGCQSGQ